MAKKVIIPEGTDASKLPFFSGDHGRQHAILVRPMAGLDKTGQGSRAPISSRRRGRPLRTWASPLFAAGGTWKDVGQGDLLPDASPARLSRLEQGLERVFPRGAARACHGGLLAAQRRLGHRDRPDRGYRLGT